MESNELLNPEFVAAVAALITAVGGIAWFRGRKEKDQGPPKGADVMQRVEGKVNDIHEKVVIIVDRIKR